MNSYLSREITKMKLNTLKFERDFGRSWISNKMCFFSNKHKLDKLKKLFHKDNINIFSPWNIRPMHMHTLFKKYQKSELKNTKLLYKNFFSIPLSFDLNINDLKNILLSIKKIFK